MIWAESRTKLTFIEYPDRHNDWFGLNPYVLIGIRKRSRRNTNVTESWRQSVLRRDVYCTDYAIIQKRSLELTFISPFGDYCIPKSICWRFTSSRVRWRSSSVICVEMEDMLVPVVRFTLSDGRSV